MYFPIICSIISITIREEYITDDTYTIYTHSLHYYTTQILPYSTQPRDVEFPRLSCPPLLMLYHTFPVKNRCRQIPFPWQPETRLEYDARHWSASQLAYRTRALSIQGRGYSMCVGAFLLTPQPSSMTTICPPYVHIPSQRCILVYICICRCN